MRQLLLVLAAGLVPGAVWTAPPDANANREFFITPQAGPYVICAASYRGPDAPDMARLTVLYLQQQHRLRAYIFDYAEEGRRQQQELQEAIQRRHSGDTAAHPRTIHIDEQCVVLIGGFRDMDAARKMLDNIKKLPPPELGQYQLDTVLAGVQGQGVQRLTVNPFASSFVTRNPTIGPEQVAREKEYDIYKHLNEDEDYSLLKCKAPWTLAVQVYRGSSVIQTAGSSSNGFLKQLGMGKDTGDHLEAAAKQAHELAAVLRGDDTRNKKKMHYEAYVLHTKNASYVTVGGFKAEDDKDLERMQAHFVELAKAYHDKLLFPQPQPMRVPQP